MSTAKAMKRPPSAKGRPVVEKIVPAPEPIVEKQPLKVLLCASEAMPFIKTGGLADVVGALPVALNQEGIHSMVSGEHWDVISFDTSSADATTFLPSSFTAR